MPSLPEHPPPAWLAIISRRDSPDSEAYVVRYATRANNEAEANALVLAALKPREGDEICSLVSLSSDAAAALHLQAKRVKRLLTSDLEHLASGQKAASRLK